MSDSTLLPCPHCGGRAELRDQVGRFSVLKIVVCGECLAQSYPSYEPDDTVAAWNRRAVAAAPNVDRLVEALVALIYQRDAEDTLLTRAFHTGVSLARLDGEGLEAAMRIGLRALVLAALATPEPPLHDPIAHAQIMNPD